ncbi:MAG: tryptophan 2,3-dioxygenase family protein, partial [Pseudomonadota bacterium]
FEHAPEAHAELSRALASPSLYDAFLFYLARQGHAVPEQLLNRDLTQAHQRTPELVPVLVDIYQDTDRYWTEYALCERLVDVEESFQLWRFRHLKTVERVIGFKRGSGGSSGVSFLKKALDLTFFPELLDVRTEL